MGGQKHLTTKQRAFVEHYLVSDNAYQSALEAGYSANTAKAKSYQLLQNQVVAAEIERRQRELVRKLVSPETMLLELKKVGFDDSTDFTVDGRPHKGKAKYKGASKLRALELMARIAGLLDKDMESAGEVVPIIDDI